MNDTLPRNELISARFPSTNLALVYADCTEAAKALEKAHLCGPAAGRALAEVLAGVSLLSAETLQESEMVSLKFDVPGPIQSVFAEASDQGRLRGFPKKKIFDELDGRESLSAEDLYGVHARVQVMRSVPGKILANSMAPCAPASVASGLRAYFAQSLQRQAAFLIRVRMGADHYVESARGMLVERMPDGDGEAFARVRDALSPLDAESLLDGSRDLPSLCGSLGLSDGVFTTVRPLAFGCRCSQERIEGALASVPESDLAEMIGEAHPLRLFCHMCGKEYDVSVDRLRELLTNR